MQNLYPDNDYRYYLRHSAKGTTWGDHKYIAIENGRYIYPEDVKRSGIGSNRPRGRQVNVTGQANVFKQNQGIAGSHQAMQTNNKTYSRFKNRTSAQKMIDKAKASSVKEKNKAASVINKQKKTIERMKKIRQVLSQGLNGIFARTEETKKKAKNKAKKLKNQFDSVLKKIIR